MEMEKFTGFFSNVKATFRSLTGFIREVANDERIPPRDKKVVLALLALIVSPFDLIPDWIPVIGLLDDAVLIALVLDYFFNVLDSDILLSHWPWDMKAYLRVQRNARFVAKLTPEWLRSRLWKFQSLPYA